MMSNLSEKLSKPADNRNGRNLKARNTGYLISLVFLVSSVVGLILNWTITPVLYLITMIFLTITLWFPQVLAGIFERKPGQKQNRDFFNRN